MYNRVTETSAPPYIKKKFIIAAIASHATLYTAKVGRSPDYTKQPIFYSLENLLNRSGQ